MQKLGLLLAIVLAAGISLLAGWKGLSGPAFAAGADFKTPESAVAAYIEGVKKQDLKAIIAASAAENMSKGYDFVAQVDRIKSLSLNIPGPSSDPFFIEINKIDFMVRIVSQVKFLTYGLMTTSEIIEGKAVKMEAADATNFASAVRADRLEGLELVKIGIPKPEIQNREQYQVQAAMSAKIYGADRSTERVALISFEGLNFVIGFTLLRYGDAWSIQSQYSTIAGIAGLPGVPKRVTPEEFEAIIR